ncbi:MAG TPA: site-specific integrase [Pseudolabrys sp.]|jgi:integrase
MRKTLTDKGVAALKSRASRYAFPDPELRGLYVRVQPSGAKSFVTVARDPYGKQVWTTIGAADVLGVDEARDLAREAIKRVRQGLPAIEPPPARPDSFKAVAENWLKRHVAAKRFRSEYEIRRVLERYVYPHWGNRDFISIKRSDISTLLDHVEDNHGAQQADKVLSVARGIANWFAGRDDDYVSPFVRGMRRHSGARTRVLEDDELPVIWKTAEGNGQFGAIVRLLLLTGQRREKVNSMKWADLADGVWTIATVEREKNNAGSLALPAQALAIIQAQPRVGENPYVFAGRGNGAYDISQSKAPFDRKLPKMPHWTLHDLRRTSRSLMSRAGVRPDIAERVMGHAIAGIEGVYDRHSYREEKADALRRLAMLVDGIVNPRDNVHKLKRIKPIPA